MKTAQDLSVNLDEQLMENINMCHARLISERDLRNEMLVISDSISVADTKTIENLNNLIQDA